MEKEESNMDNNNEMREAVIFHDKNDERWLQEKLSPVKIDPKKKSPEYRQYLVLVYLHDGVVNDYDFGTTFIVATGRKDAYFAIKDLIDIMDLNQSIVILEGNPALTDSITVLQFLRHVRDDQLIEDESGYIVDEAIEIYDAEEES
jgi:hypothetical protein